MFILSFSISFICLVVILFSFSTSSIFGTQHQLTHPLVKSSTLPLRKVPAFQGVAHRQTNFTLSCVIPLWDSATAHSRSGKELNPFLSGRCPFFRALLLGMQFSLHPASSLSGTQQQLTYPLVKSSTLPLKKMSVFQGSAPWHTIFTASCLIPLWDSATPHSPSGKEFDPSSQEVPFFQGAAPWHTIFTASCVIPLWDSITAH